MTTATMNAPPTLRIDLKTPLPQFRLGLPVWVGLDTDIYGIITGVKFSNGQWYYLVQDDGWECWAVEELIFPIDYHGYRIQILETQDPKGYYLGKIYTFQLLHLETGTAIAPNTIDGNPNPDFVISAAREFIDEELLCDLLTKNQQRG